MNPKRRKLGLSSAISAHSVDPVAFRLSLNAEHHRRGMMCRSRRASDRYRVRRRATSAATSRLKHQPAEQQAAQ